MAANGWATPMIEDSEKFQQSVPPLKTNISPENQWLEDVCPFEIAPFFVHMSVFTGAYHLSVFLTSFR